MVSILLIIDNYYLDRYAIEIMLKHCRETKVELLVINNSGDDSVIKFLNEIVKAEAYEHVLSVGEISEITFNKAQAYNKLIKEAKFEYVCIFDIKNIVGRNWLYDLLHYHTIIPKVGATAIPDFQAKKVYNGLLDKNDEIVNVWKTDDKSIEGIALFRNDLLNSENCFDENLEKYFLKQFTLKISQLGSFENFYVPGQVSIHS